MIQKYFKYLQLFVVCGILFGCTPQQISDPAYVPSANYETPPGLTSETAATLVGSKDVLANPLSADPTIYLVSIDGKPVNLGWRSWNSPTLVTPGEHYIEFDECMCGLFVSPWAGGVNVEVVLKAGQTYTLRATPPNQSHIFGPSWSEGWVEDENGNVVSKVVGDNGDLIAEKYQFSLNPQSGGPDSDPLFLPTK